MSYTTNSGRLQILDDVAAAGDQLSIALAGLGDAYEQLDEHAADVMEERLFRPLQAALGQLSRTHSEFASRSGVHGRDFAQAQVGLPVSSRLALERAADCVRVADETLGDLQDSMLPVEVGDRELREGLARARTLLAPLEGAAMDLVRVLGR